MHIYIYIHIYGGTYIYIFIYVFKIYVCNKMYDYKNLRFVSHAYKNKGD